MANTNERRIRPALKWPGGKYRVLRHILPHLPASTRLVEPFAGAAAVSINSGFRRLTWNDNNADLMNFYRQVKKGGDEFIGRASCLFTGAHNTADNSYSLRDEFNSSDDTIRKAEIFLYLNRHGFNGLCRYNGSGGFNVPLGQYKRPYFPETELRYLAKRCKSVRLECGDFERTLRRCRAGDVAYCDPPYVPLSSTAYFTSYAAGGFSLNEQTGVDPGGRAGFGAGGVHTLATPCGRR